MHDALAVRAIERARDLPRDAHRLGDRQLLLARKPRAQRLAAHEWHDVEEEAVSFVRVDQREDMRMVEAGGDGDLAEEPLGTERRGKLRAQHLDGDGPVVPLIMREIDRRHPAATELPIDAVPTSQGFGESHGRLS